ncbi:MAG: YdbH domain-containing protein [Candidatus Omnitrophica bacterium]|nr:YdbH domain-containing protein [Candidatus Omnitrophota bacterium]MCM8831311.1 YdbH domain-containing protein [Candidatus Omnitrophota bacterium]
MNTNTLKTNNKTKKTNLIFKYSLPLFLILILFIFIFAKPIILYIAKRQLQKIFTQSKILIRDCTFNPFSLLSFKDIEIKEDKVYDFKAKKIAIEYSIISLIFKKNISLVTLDDLNLTFYTLPVDFKLSNAEARGFLKIDRLKISKLTLNMKAKDIVFKVDFNADLNLDKKSIDYLEVFLNDFKMPNLTIPSASILFSKNETVGKILIKNFTFNKIKIFDIFSNVILKDKLIEIKNFSAKLFGGDIKGGGNFNFNNKEYDFILHFFNIDLQNLVKDLELIDKFEITGKWQGIFMVNGIGKNFKNLDGNFSSVQAGNITITDKKILEEIAKRKDLSLEILVERFTDYKYNKANMDVSILGKNLVLGIVFEGRKGKSNFQIVLHDFLDIVLGFIKLTGGVR